MPQDPAPKNRKRWSDQEEALLLELGVEGFLSSPGCSRDPEAVKQRAWLIERRKKKGASPPVQSLVLPDGEDPGNRRNRASEAPGAKIVRDWIEMVVGDDPSREGLQGTPERVLRASRELFGGYERKPEDLFTCFTEGACQEMVCLRDIEFYSTCEHHLLPFFGRVHVAYLPGGKVIGISKLARLVEIYSRRLQIQERLSAQIADALMNHGGALGSMVIIEAQHLCMTSRGIQKQNSVMSTSAIRGRFKESDIARSEALALLLGGRGREIS